MNDNEVVNMIPSTITCDYCFQEFDTTSPVILGVLNEMQVAIACPHCGNSVIVNLE